MSRQALHQVAEHVIAKATYASIGRIGLRPHPGGFKAQDDSFVVEDGLLNGVAIDGKTLRELGATERALPYAANTPFDDAPLSVTAEECRALGDFYALVAAALPEGDTPQIWPEHFDIATVLDEKNYGGSPGDATYDRPYLYVGPWDRSDPSTFDDPWGWTLHEPFDLDQAKAFFDAH